MNQKYIPILFSPPMVQAQRDGRKTMTRRTKGLENVNVEPDFYIWLNEYPQDEIPRQAIPYDTKYYYAFTGKHNNSSLVIEDCPYGKPGDILWVRETFYAYGSWAIDKFGSKFIDETSSFGDYKYVDNPPVKVELKRRSLLGWYKRPSLFMPKEVCRTWLEIVSVRPERLQEISQNDCVNEGIQQLLMSKMQMAAAGSKRFLNYMAKPQLFNDAVKPYESFCSLWQSINGEQSWISNPWVWVITFKSVEKPAGFC